MDRSDTYIKWLISFALKEKDKINYFLENYNDLDRFDYNYKEYQQLYNELENSLYIYEHRGNIDLILFCDGVRFILKNDLKKREKIFLLKMKNLIRNSSIGENNVDFETLVEELFQF